MKPKDRQIPTIEEYYELQLQLRPVVSETYPQRRGNRTGTGHPAALRDELIDLIGNRVHKSTTTLH